MRQHAGKNEERKTLQSGIFFFRHQSHVQKIIVIILTDDGVDVGREEAFVESDPDPGAAHADLGGDLRASAQMGNDVAVDELDDERPKRPLPNVA